MTAGTSGSEPRAQTAVVTGASSGIGAATARLLAARGFRVVLGARREQRLAELADELGGGASWQPLDVGDPVSVARFCSGVAECSVLVCNAGGALGLAPVGELDEADWMGMLASNVMGVARTVRHLLAKLVASGDGRIAVVTSVAAHQVYPGGGGYAAAKHAAAAVTDTVRLETLEAPVRVIEVAPGLVQTEFSTVRFGGDTQRAAGVYAGLEPLSAEDVADAIVWAVTRPAHVTVARIDLYPRDQAGARDVHRR